MESGIGTGDKGIVIVKLGVLVRSPRHDNQRLLTCYFLDGGRIGGGCRRVATGGRLLASGGGGWRGTRTEHDGDDDRQGQPAPDKRNFLSLHVISPDDGETDEITKIVGGGQEHYNGCGKQRIVCILTE